MKIVTLEDFLKEHPTYEEKLGWKPSSKYGGIENPRFGAVRRVVMCDDSEKPLFDQYQIEEKPGAIIIPYYREKNELYIGIIESLRAIIKDPETGLQGYVISLEVPRGFGIGKEIPQETAIRELGEETNNVVLSLEYIGLINPNTAFYVNKGIDTFQALVDPSKKGNFTPDAKEKILKSKFYSLPEINNKIREGDIFCGLTKAALYDFILKNKIV